MATIRIKSKAFPDKKAFDIDEKVWQNMQARRDGQQVADSSKFTVVEPAQKPKEVAEAAKTKESK